MKKIRAILAYIILLVGISLLAYCIVYLSNYFHKTNETEEGFESVRELIQETNDTQISKDSINSFDGTKLELRPKMDYSQLYETNSDFLGWIKIDGTNIDYPVMLTPNNEEYYLYRNFNKGYDGNGTPFCEAEIDPITPSDNITIYGHHIKGGIMFHNLDKFRKKEFYDEHKLITFDTIYRWGTYEIVSVYLTDVTPGNYEYWNVKDCTEEEFNEYVKFFTKKALYKTDLINDIEYGDKLISLSTCAYHTENGRLVVVAKQIECEETDLYKSLNIDTVEDEESISIAE